MSGENTTCQCTYFQNTCACVQLQLSAPRMCMRGSRRRTCPKHWNPTGSSSAAASPAASSAAAVLLSVAFCRRRLSPQPHDPNQPAWWVDSCPEAALKLASESAAATAAFHLGITCNRAHALLKWVAAFWYVPAKTATTSKQTADVRDPHLTPHPLQPIAIVDSSLSSVNLIIAA